MSESQEILKELAEIIVNASNEDRGLSSQESEFFEIMFEKALKISSSDEEN